MNNYMVWIKNKKDEKKFLKKVCDQVIQEITQIADTNAEYVCGNGEIHLPDFKNHVHFIMRDQMYPSIDYTIKDVVAKIETVRPLRLSGPRHLFLVLFNNAYWVPATTETADTLIKDRFYADVWSQAFKDIFIKKAEGVLIKNYLDQNYKEIGDGFEQVLIDEYCCPEDKLSDFFESTDFKTEVDNMVYRLKGKFLGGSDEKK